MDKKATKTDKKFRGLVCVCVCVSVCFVCVCVCVRAFIYHKNSFEGIAKTQFTPPPTPLFFVQTCLTFPLRPEQLIFPAFPAKLCTLPTQYLSSFFFTLIIWCKSVVTKNTPSYVLACFKTLLRFLYILIFCPIHTPKNDISLGD